MLGYHVLDFGMNPLNMFAKAKKNEAKCIQIFGRSPRSKGNVFEESKIYINSLSILNDIEEEEKKKEGDDEEKEKETEGEEEGETEGEEEEKKKEDDWESEMRDKFYTLNKENIPVFMHDTYTHIFTSSAFNIKSIKTIAHDAMIASAFSSKCGIDTGIVIHPGYYVNKNEDFSIKKASANIVKTVEYMDKEKMADNCKIFMENMEGSNGKIKLCNNPSCMKKMVKTIKIKLGEKMSDRIGICFDTCHAFMTDNYLNAETMTDLIKKYDAMITNHSIGIIHLNDAVDNIKEKHEVPFEGVVDRTALIAAMKFANDNNKPMICELTHFEGDMRKLLKKILKTTE